MLDLEVVPGKSVGEFVLGMTISEAISKIQAEPLITQAELKYHETTPLSAYIIIDLTEDGIILSFEPVSQRLRGIEIYKTVKLRLRYSGSVFCSPDLDLHPTMALIDERFGPSFPGEYEKDQHKYNVHYPGLTFTFPIPPEYDAIYANPHEQPLELPNGKSPITSQIIIYYGPKLQFASLPPIDSNSSYFEEINVTISEGVYFQKRECFVGFESSTQDVVSDLGPPDKIYFKEQDKMKIHSSSGTAVGMKGTEYFYNYFSLGLDILFDVTKHTVKKIILHTNFPSHYDFNRYTKCNFKITKDDSPSITADSKWTEVQEVFGNSGKPVVHKRKFQANPFGSTFFYGYQDIIFEVMNNGHIASVCIFRSTVDPKQGP